jgi:hypothetical protein
MSAKRRTDPVEVCAASPDQNALTFSTALRERLSALPAEVSGISLTSVTDTSLPAWLSEVPDWVEGVSTSADRSEVVAESLTGRLRAAAPGEVSHPNDGDGSQVSLLSGRICYGLGEKDGAVRELLNVAESLSQQPECT